MELKVDDVRNVMLDLEQLLPYRGGVDNDQLSQTDLYQQIKKDRYLYTLEKLVEAGYIKMDQYMGESFDVTEITYDGHQFLDTIRDNKVWTKTKHISKGFSSISIGSIQTIASTVITSLIQSQMKANGWL